MKQKPHLAHAAQYAAISLLCILIGCIALLVNHPEIVSTRHVTLEHIALLLSVAICSVFVIHHSNKLSTNKVFRVHGESISWVVLTATMIVFHSLPMTVDQIIAGILVGTLSTFWLVSFTLCNSSLLYRHSEYSREVTMVYALKRSGVDLLITLTINLVLFGHPMITLELAAIVALLSLSVSILIFGMRWGFPQLQFQSKQKK